MNTLRKTRIVCTIGPAVDDVEIMKNMLRAGMNVARFNFSHDIHENHADRVAKLRKASQETGIPVALLLDTKGPEIRTGQIKGGAKINLVNGEKITLTTEEVEGTEKLLGISYKKLPSEVSPGNHILIADGLVDLEVESAKGNEICCVVRSGGELGSRKNVNVPGIKTSLPAITEKDKEDILFAVKHNMDFIAASFIRKASDVQEILDLLAENDSPIRVIPKIEDQEGLDNIDEIIHVSHGIMIARGDLGVQLPPEAIPMAQKRITEKCNRQNKPVITATQMLDSMINNPNPTRAELTDVANAIFDGTDAIMLSGETASGSYPIRSIETMHNVAMAVETSPEYTERTERYFTMQANNSGEIGHAVAKSAYLLAQDVDATAIITPTLRGNTPRLLSKFRPKQRIIAVTTSETAFRQLLLQWGVFPILAEFVNNSEIMIQNALRAAQKAGFISKNDKVVTAAGLPLNSPIPMNTIKVHFMGNILNRGIDGSGGKTSGLLVKGVNFAEVLRKAPKDTPFIALCKSIDETADLSSADHLTGLIVEEQPAADVKTFSSRKAGLVVICGVPSAYAQFEEGLMVSLDGVEKIIYEGALEE
ncbi:pyruvate kinase [Spirochaeta dissipatitropha]